MGQGVHTVALQVAVEELGVDPATCRVIVDTTRELGAGQTTGQPGHADGRGRGRRRLPRRRKADGCRIGVDYEGEYRVDWTNKLERRRRAPGHPLDVRLRRPARRHRPRDRRASSESSPPHDVGRAVNPLLCEGQIEGSVHMGLGYALTEDFPADDRPAAPPT